MAVNVLPCLDSRSPGEENAGNLARPQFHQEDVMRSMLYRVLFFTIVCFACLCGSAAAQQLTPVSGYEIYLGHNCRIAGAAATCGTTFSGWTGIQQPNGGFLPFPGTGQGAWSLQINYVGKPAFGASVNVVGGNWSFLFLNGTRMHGTVLNGSVTWPADANSSIGNGCLTGEAFAQANITVAGGSPTVVEGCLHDLPAGSVIPPTVWGAFLF
jgi:hypothetical protein